MSCIPWTRDQLAEQILEASPDAVAVVDHQGLIQFVNQKFTKLLGFSFDQIVGTVWDLVAPGTPHCDTAPQQKGNATAPYASTQGNSYPIDACCQDDSRKRVMLSFHDIVHADQTLRIYHLLTPSNPSIDRNHLESERMAAISQMASGLAHESRNSLQKAFACLDLLELDLESNEDQLRLASQIRKSLSDLLWNYDTVRRYAEPIRLNLERASLVSLCQVAFDELLQNQRDKPHEIAFVGSLESDRLCAIDRSKMKTVFRQLLENAVEATDGAARIEARCEAVRWRDRDAVSMDVHDFGSGFSDHSLELAFEPFFTTKQHGTGLGLSFCRRIVEAHEGEIVAANDSNRGAVVRITIPIQPNQTASLWRISTGEYFEP